MDDSKSKTQKKREAEALQKLGVQLISLSHDKLETLPLSSALKQAILEAKTLRSHGAIRRQAQLIGKLMRSIDSESLLEAYDQLLAEERTQTASFHEAEIWRARLIQEGKEALTDFIDHYHPEDSQQLRQLIKKAIEEQQSGRYPGAGKALFRYIRSCLS